ncbi:MAG: hypothetical protein CO141_03250, partial [Candidatus Moranbacteria bacterium CG_4_9_14_3_um_filter_42_9]
MGNAVGKLHSITKVNITCLLLAVFSSAATVSAATRIDYYNNGEVDSTVEINDTTTNGPELADNDYYGVSIANIGDLN